MTLYFIQSTVYRISNVEKHKLIVNEIDIRDGRYWCQFSKKKNGFEDKNLAEFDLTDLFTDFP